MVLQTNPSTIVHVATMESENYATENTTWLNLNSSKFTVPPAMPSTNATPGGDQSIMMNNAYRVGPAKSLKVFPGDVITGSVSAYFSTTSGWSPVTTTTMAAAVSGVLAGGSSLIDGGISAAYNPSPGNPLLSLSGTGSSAYPNAYLNYILFDDQYNPLAGRSYPVQNLPNSRHTVQFDQSVAVQQLGYMFIYLSFDDNSAQNVYFDDLKIVVEESPVIQVNNYYPYGMVSGKNCTMHFIIIQEHLIFGSE